MNILKQAIASIELNAQYDPEWAADELKLYLENDGDLYRQQFMPIIKNLMRKHRKGIYDPTLAPKLWMYLVDRAAKKYYEDGMAHQDMVDWNKAFPKKVREEVAKKLAEEQYEMIKEGEYDDWYEGELAKDKENRERWSQPKKTEIEG
jgi:hypothetical protein